jgi:putative ABC transport system substrate-binding protein
MTMVATRRLCIAAIGAAALPPKVRAQRPGVPIIGLLDSSAATVAKISAFNEGLRIEGFLRNQNVIIEYHSAEADYNRLPDLVADFINRRVLLIVALGVPAAQAAQAATATIPVVFAVGPDPARIGLLASLNHPGANMTGVTNTAVGREQKRLELLHEVFPAASVFALLINPHSWNAEAQIQDGLAAAQLIGVQIRLIRASANREFENAFAEMVESGASGLAIADDELFISASAELGSLAIRHGIPAIFQGAAFASAGGLMSYGNSLAETYHQAGVYTGLILHGANPAELPVYQSTRIEFIINLRTANSLGTTVPPTVLERAGQVIK